MSFEDMKGLDPAFFQHQINLHKDVKPVQQRRYWLNPNYVVQVKEEIEKLLRVDFQSVTTVKQEAYDCLKKMPTKVPVVQQPD